MRYFWEIASNKKGDKMQSLKEFLEGKRYIVYAVFGPGDAFESVFLTEEAARADAHARNKKEAEEMEIDGYATMSRDELTDVLDDASHVAAVMGVDGDGCYFLGNEDKKAA